jgi:hypothetical protein
MKMSLKCISVQVHCCIMEGVFGQVGKYPSLNVTDATDSRFAALGEDYRSYGVEEIMDMITQGGRLVNPNHIPVRRTPLILLPDLLFVPPEGTLPKTC